MFIKQLVILRMLVVCLLGVNARDSFKQDARISIRTAHGTVRSTDSSLELCPEQGGYYV